eukprot:Pgem_evm2s19982
MLINKPAFLLEAKKYMTTEFIAWCDIGMIRYEDVQLTQFPKRNLFNEKKIMVFALNKNKCKVTNNENYFDYYFDYENPPNNVLTIGGFFMMHRNMIDIFNQLFYTKLESIILEKQKWVGMEQFILSDVACENYNNIVKCKCHPYLFS